MKGFGILACPAYSTRKGNPYNYILYSNIERQGHGIYEYDFSVKKSLQFGFSRKYRIFHIHWPTNVLYGSSFLKAGLRLNVFFLFVNLIKLLGKKVVWTVHNLEDHEGNFPALQQKLNAFLYRRVDGFISLNKSGLELIRQKATHNGHQKFAHINHPHYQGYYTNEVDKLEARRRLAIPPDKFVFLFLGQIRAYKNVTGLVKAYKALGCPQALLLIAGSVHKDVREELAQVLQDAPGILFIDSFVEDEDLQLYFNGADVVVTPYNKIFNSGSALLNVSFHKPTLAPDLWALRELKQQVGPRWIKTYQGQISPAVLKESMQEIKQDAERLEAATPLIDSLHPQLIADQTIAFYRSLLN
ncbi:glycosyltransferase [Rufibacter psychrotolerans]|uniref:glycosyltransferase n=1 Tax=Rufibacter psychrotolerans TaxID=2812556 RepID=UPI0019689637|nr:glycosyltransferase [Rufibacter sp. SYSU D00308]